MAISHKILGFTAISIFDMRLIITDLWFQTHLPNANQVSVSIMFEICCFKHIHDTPHSNNTVYPMNYIQPLSRFVLVWSYWKLFCLFMMTSSNGNIFRVSDPLCGEFTGPRWIPHTEASDAELWFSLISPRINGWVNNSEAGDLRRHRAHYAVIVMSSFELAEALMGFILSIPERYGNKPLLSNHTLTQSCNRVHKYWDAHYTFPV